MTWAPTFVPERLDGSVLRRLLPALVGANVDHIRRNPGTPLLYQARPRYVEDPPGREQWLTIPHVLERGFADCKSLAAWRAADLRCRFGVDAKCVWGPPDESDPAGPVYHILVLIPSCTAAPDPRSGRPGAHVEDPSQILGMGWNGLGPGGAPLRRPNLPAILLR